MKIKKKLIVVLIILCFFFIVYSCSDGESSSKDIGKALYDSGCNNCHDNTVICLNVGKDMNYWNKTVTRMAKKVKGQKVNVEFLAKSLHALDKQNPLCN